MVEKVVDVSIFPPGTECLYGQNKQTEWVCKVAWRLFRCFFCPLPRLSRNCGVLEGFHSTDPGAPEGFRCGAKNGV